MNFCFFTFISICYFRGHVYSVQGTYVLHYTQSCFYHWINKFYFSIKRKMMRFIDPMVKNKFVHGAILICLFTLDKVYFGNYCLYILVKYACKMQTIITCAMNNLKDFLCLPSHRSCNRSFLHILITSKQSSTIWQSAYIGTGVILKAFCEKWIYALIL